MILRPPKNYNEYSVSVPMSIDWMLKTLWKIKNGVVNRIIAGNNISISPADGMGDVTINADNGGANFVSYYGSFYDSTNQNAIAINTAYPMLIGGTDISNQVSITSGSRITFAVAGIYNIQWSGQFENTDTQEHDVSVWLRKNGTNVIGSAGFVAVVSSHGGIHGHTLPSWNYLVQVNAGDYVQLVWSTTSTQVFIAYYPELPPAPSVSSLIVTATFVSSI